MAIFRLGPEYVYSDGSFAGVVAANNFLTLVNPIGLGRLINVTGAFFSSSSTGASSSTATMRGFRVSSVSGGTVKDVSTIGKFVTADPDPVGEIRIDNPTMTLGAQLFNVPPPTGAAATSNPVTQIRTGGAFILAPGEGVGFKTNSGGTEQRWNISVTWIEQTL